MNDQLIASIQAFTLNARKLLERETEEQLQGLYGWLPDGSFAAGTALTLPEAAETRARLEAFVAEEKEVGVNAAAAREKIKRETAFTWLNRNVAFRMMEERGILKSTLGKLHKSNAFIFWLTDVKGLANIPASTPVNALGEGPVDAAYREFILWQCGELAAEVSVLFDPQTLASRFCPRPLVLKELVESMQAADVADAWKAGNEEAIGWVYQGFSAQELQAAFAAARENKKKFEPQDIPAVTQLFTIRWVVRFLVENTLGRTWLEMHPDSRMAESLGYFAPPKHPQPRTLRRVKDITFLDPCCGSMHFGLLAFDLFAEMYREERENAGKPGWPGTPSASTEDEIPELILAHNIHGIDIDLRAIQVSALTLLLKARMLNPKAGVTDQNLACANVQQITGGQLESFVEKAKFSHPIYERVLRRLASRLQDSQHLGSLLRIDSEIRQLVDAERSQSKDVFNQLPGIHPEQFDTQEGIEEFFDILTDQIGRHLDHFVQESAHQRESMFAAEASKGLRLLRLAEKSYDVVATNPPYLSGRKMSKRLATLMEQEYKEGKGDLYAAFIMRSQELLAPDGLMGMLTMHSFMFISSYEDLRSRLRKEIAVETLAHFGGGLFAVGNPGTLQTAAFVLRREPDTAKREGQVGTYFRLVKERDADAKRLAFESALAALRQGDEHHQLFHYQQSDFDAIPGKPWVYWAMQKLCRMFTELPLLGSLADVVIGLQTGDRGRFVRYWWEVGTDKIDWHRADGDNGMRWVPYMKSGGAKSWYGLQYYVANWSADGGEIKTTSSSRPQNVRYYFLPGVNFPMVTSGTFTARYTPSGFIFDNSAPSVITKDFHLPLAVLNSGVGKWFLRMINPTLNTPPGDVAKVPVPQNCSGNLKIHVSEILQICTDREACDELTWGFTRPSLRNEFADSHAKQKELESLVMEELFAGYGLERHEVAEIENELTGMPMASDGDAGNDEYSEDEDDEATGDLSPADWARSWVSYALGTVLGRFEIGRPGGLGCGDFPETTVAEIRKLVDPCGIMPCDTGHPQDLAARAVACLEWMLGTQPARDAIRTATSTEGDPIEALRGWLDRFTGTPDKSFWKFHHPLYRKRPVYWPFQSPKKSYTLWVFHEKIGANTLHALKQLTDEHLNLLDRRITDLRPTAATSRAAEKELQKLLEEGDDVREFSVRLKAHIDAGYESCIDDGVLLNAAPLHDLLPSWPETRAAWKELEAAKYDWAHQAMRYWPDRVTEACRTNRSFAIAHNLEHLCPADPPKAGKKRGRKKIDASDLL